MVVTPPATTTYTLTATNAVGSLVTATATVTVVSPPTIVSFTASPATISTSQSSLLKWNVVGATSISIDNGIGIVQANGSLSVTPTVTTTYTLTASNVVGPFTATATAQTTVTFSTVFMPIVTSFAASPPSVGPGGTTTLTAVFDEGPGGSASIDQGVGPVTSETPVTTGTLSSSTTFTLTVTNGTETATAQVRVPAGDLAVFVGTPTDPGSQDGTGKFASFNSPHGVAVDTSGNVYVADTNNNTIRKITPAGDVSTLAGTPGVTGSLDGQRAAAQFNNPTGVAVDSNGNVYVADSNNDTIRMITAGGAVSTIAGTPLQIGSTDGAGTTTALFNYPTGVAVDANGNIYVTDSSNYTIREITDGVVSTLAGTALVAGSADGAGAKASFNLPNGVAVDANENLYVADTNNNTIRIITPGGIVSTLAGTAGVHGFADGNGTSASFYGPLSLALDTSPVTSTSPTPVTIQSVR